MPLTQDDIEFFQKIFIDKLEKLFDEKLNKTNEKLDSVIKTQDTIIKVKCDDQELRDHIGSEFPHPVADKYKKDNKMATIGISATVGGVIVGIFQFAAQVFKWGP